MLPSAEREAPVLTGFTVYDAMGSFLFFIFGNSFYRQWEDETAWFPPKAESFVRPLASGPQEFASRV